MRIFFLSLLCLWNTLHAQGYNTSQYGPSSQIRFSAMPALYNNLDYMNVGAELFRSSAGQGGEFVVSYGQSLWKGFGVNVGGGIGFVPYNFSFDAVPDPESIISDAPGATDHAPHRSAEIILTFPMMIEKKFPLFQENKIFLNLEAGIKWNLILNNSGSSGGGYWTRTDDGGDVRYFDYRFTSVEDSEFISYVFKAGLLHVNRKDNSLSWNMVLQRSFPSMLTGTYEFNELGYESSGTTDLYNTYIGIELIFGLSLDRNLKR